MRATLAYTSARILLFIAALAVLYLIGARGLALLALALLISGIISFVVLSRARDRMSAALTSRVSGARLGRTPGAAAGPDSGDAGSGEPSRARSGRPPGARPRVLAGVRSRLSELSQRLDEGTRVEDED
jgi:hypothetical protein